MNSNRRKQKSACFVVSIAVAAAFGGSLFGYGLGVYNPLQNLIAFVFGWKTQETKNLNKGLVTALFPLGAMFGTIFSAYISNKIGRRKAILLGDLIYSVGVGLECVTAFFSLLMGRFFTGFGAGMFSAIVPVFIREIAPQEISGRLGGLFQTLLNFGLNVSFWFGVATPAIETIETYSLFMQNWWRFSFLFAFLFIILQFVLFVFVINQETPVFLLMVEKEEDCKQVLSKFQHSEFIEEIFEEIKCGIGQKPTIKLNEIFQKKNRKRLQIGMLLCFFQQFVGANAINFYSTSIFEHSANPTPKEEFEARIITGVLGIFKFLFALLSGVVVDKFGRKTILLIGIFLIQASLFFLSLSSYYNWHLVEIICVFLFCIAFSISLGPIVWIYLPEVMSQGEVAFCSFTHWIWVAIIGLVFPIVAGWISQAGVFLFFTIVSLFAFVFVWLKILETKGVSRENLAKLQDVEIDLKENTEKPLYSNDSLITQKSEKDDESLRNGTSNSIEQ